MDDSVELYSIVWKLSSSRSYSRKTYSWHLCSLFAFSMESCWFDTWDEGQKKWERKMKIEWPNQATSWQQQTFTCNSLDPSPGCCLSSVAIFACQCWTHCSVNCVSRLDPAVLIRSDRPPSSIQLCTVEGSPRSSWEWLHVLSPPKHCRWAAWIWARRYADLAWAQSWLFWMRKRGREDMN